MFTLNRYRVQWSRRRLWKQKAVEKNLLSGETWKRPDMNVSKCFLLFSFKQNLWPYFFEISGKRNCSLKFFAMPKGKLEKDLKSWPWALRNIYIFNQGWGVPNVIASWMPRYLSFKAKKISGDPLTASSLAADHLYGFKLKLFIW